MRSIREIMPELNDGDEESDPIFGHGVSLAENPAPQLARGHMRIFPGFERYKGMTKAIEQEKEDIMEREHNGVMTVYTVQVTPSTRAQAGESVTQTELPNNTATETAKHVGEYVLHLPEPETLDGSPVDAVETAAS